MDVVNRKTSPIFDHDQSSRAEGYALWVENDRCPEVERVTWAIEALNFSCASPRGEMILPPLATG
jgi:hypothetical protein